MKSLAFAVQRTLDVSRSLYEVGLGHPKATPNAMTSPKYEDPIYSQIKRNVRNALDLEYAIRASELVSHDQMEDLKKFEGAIVEFWMKLGVSKAEIYQENLLEFAWDTLQVGFPLSRRHDRVFDPDLLQAINLGLSLIRKEFSAELKLLAIPAASFYRVCDLLSGTDLIKVISKVQEGLKAARKYSKKDEVPLYEFGINMREPIHLHPSFRYGIRETDGKTVFGFEVDLSGEFDLFEWRRQLNEFQSQYAVYRASIVGRHDTTTRSLMQEFLIKEFEGSQSEFDVPGHASFLPVLTGLYCWDLYKRDHKTLDSAITEAYKLYPKGKNTISFETMRNNYRMAAARIHQIEARFRNAAKPPIANVA